MQIINLTSYAEFVVMERPYYPKVHENAILIANFSVNEHIKSAKAHNRFVIANVPVVNQGKFVAVYNMVLSCQGMRERWFYFIDERRWHWTEIGWDRQHDVVYGFTRKLKKGQIWPEAMPPSRKIDSYIKQLERQGWL